MTYARTILVVDDCPVGRLLVARALERGGFRAEGCRWGEIPWRARGRWDAVVAEPPGPLPVTWASVRAMMGPLRGLPAMAFTASAMRHDHLLARAAGFCAYRPRPSGIRGLDAAVAAMLSGVEAEDRAARRAGVGGHRPRHLDLEVLGVEGLAQDHLPGFV